MTHAKINIVSTLPPSTKAAVKPSHPASHSGSIAIHKRQSFWQIGAPLGIGVIILLGFLALAIFSATQGSSELDRWTNVSLMFLILPAVAAGLVFLVLFGGLVYLLARLLNFLPHYTQLGQAYAYYISALVRSWADRAASPIIAIRSSWAGFQTLWRKVF
jgi:hypothetical protein